MSYGFSIQQGCSRNSLLPPKGEGLARAPCLQKSRKRAGFPAEDQQKSRFSTQVQERRRRMPLKKSCWALLAQVTQSQVCRDWNWGEGSHWKGWVKLIWVSLPKLRTKISGDLLCCLNCSYSAVLWGGFYLGGKKSKTKNLWGCDFTECECVIWHSQKRLYFAINVWSVNRQAKGK